MDAESSGPRLASAAETKSRRARRMRRIARARQRHSDVAAPPFGFVIGGVQKAGTSTLFALLGAHPQVARPRVKELHFFDDDALDWADPDYAWYSRKARRTPQSRIAGEATPRYLFWPEALERAYRYNPQLRLVLAFRDPIERAFSQWAMLKGRPSGTGRPDFAASIDRSWATAWPTDASQIGTEPDATIVSRGFYADQWDHALTVFPRRQFLLLDYHEMFSDLARTLDRCTDFIGVDRFDPYPESLAERVSPQSLDTNPPTAESVLRLAECYRDDLARFATAVDIDVGSWPTSRILRGELEPVDFAALLAAKIGLLPATSRR